MNAIRTARLHGRHLVVVQRIDFAERTAIIGFVIDVEGARVRQLETVTVPSQALENLANDRELTPDLANELWADGVIGWAERTGQPVAIKRCGARSRLLTGAR